MGKEKISFKQKGIATYNTAIEGRKEGRKER
jgi:hypothetical protein